MITPPLSKVTFSLKFGSTSHNYLLECLKSGIIKPFTATRKDGPIIGGMRNAKVSSYTLSCIDGELCSDWVIREVSAHETPRT